MSCSIAEARRRRAFASISTLVQILRRKPVSHTADAAVGPIISGD
jgi:hypothetical protein